MRRSGNVCDTLVFLLVAVLLPAWLLGQLYLSFFPATGSEAASQVGSNQASAVASLDDDGSSDDAANGKIDLLDEEPDGSASSTSTASAGQQGVQWQRELDGFKSKISGLNTENQNLTLKATKLEELNSKQDREIVQLKNRLEQIPEENGREKISLMSTELSNAQSDYAQLEKEFKTIQFEKSQLASEFTELKSKNQQLAMRAESSNNDKEVQQLEAEVGELKSQLQKSTSDLGEQRRLAEQMQNDRPNDSETTEALVAESKKLLGESNAEKSRLQGRVNELISVLESTKSNFAKQNNELTESKDQLQRLNAKYTLTLKRLAASTPASSNRPSNTARTNPPVRLETPQPLNTVQPANEEYRDYVSSRGNQSRLAFIQWVGDDQVVVRSFANKKLYQVPIGRFSTADQQYLRSLNLANGQ